jgi:hypothetical protein
MNVAFDRTRWSHNSRCTPGSLLLFNTENHGVSAEELLLFNSTPAEFGYRVALTTDYLPGPDLVSVPPPSFSVSPW